MFSVTASAKITTPTNTLKTNGNGGKTDVGMWYITYNTKGIFGNNMGSGYPIKYRMLMPDGSYGILDSKNTAHIDFQIQKLAEAKTDFVLFDLTNGGLTSKVPYGWADGKNESVANAKLACERIAKWNDTHDWKIKYAVAVGCYVAIRDGLSIGECTEYQAQGVYEMFYKNSTYGGDDYYQVDGKPMLIIHDWGENVLTVPHGWNQYKGNRTYGDKFFVRNGQGGEKGTYGWHTRYGTLVDDEVELLCPGQRTAGNEKANIYRDNGNYYLTCWETVLNNKLPRIVMIASFNDYCEQTGVWIADSSKCKGEYDEQWTDSTGQINNSMYWDMTVEGIKLVRIANGELKGEWKSEWFNLGNGRPVRVNVQTPDPSTPTDSTEDKTDSTSNDSTSNDSVSKVDKSSKKEEVTTEKNLTPIIIVVVVTVLILLAISIGIVIIYKKKNKLEES